jgi:cytochrome bd-type quinol oxidase subunit 2
MLIVIGVVLALAYLFFLWCIFVTAKRADEENERDAPPKEVKSA